MNIGYKTLAEFKSRLLHGNDLDGSEIAQARAEAYSNTVNSARALYLIGYFADATDLEPLSRIALDAEAKPSMRARALMILCDNLKRAKEFAPLIIEGLQADPESFIEKFEAAQMARCLLQQGRSGIACELLVGILFDENEDVYTRESSYLALLAGAGLSAEEVRQKSLAYASKGFDPDQDVDRALIDRARRNQLLN